MGTPRRATRARAPHVHPPTPHALTPWLTQGQRGTAHTHQPSVLLVTTPSVGWRQGASTPEPPPAVCDVAPLAGTQRPGTPSRGFISCITDCRPGGPNRGGARAEGDVVCKPDRCAFNGCCGWGGKGGTWPGGQCREDAPSARDVSLLSCKAWGCPLVAGGVQHCEPAGGHAAAWRSTHEIRSARMCRGLHLTE